MTPEGTRHYTLDPLELGIPRCEVQDLKGGDAILNAQILQVCPPTYLKPCTRSAA